MEISTYGTYTQGVHVDGKITQTIILTGIAVFHGRNNNFSRLVYSVIREDEATEEGKRKFMATPTASG